MRMRRRAWHWILPPFRAPVVLAGYCHCGLGLPLSHTDTGPARVHMWPWCRWMMPLSQPMATLLCHVYTIHNRLSLIAARSACLLLAGWVVFGILAAPQLFTHGAKDWPMNTAICMHMRRRAWRWILPPFRAPVVLAGYCHCGLGLPISHTDTGPALVHMWPWCRWMMPLSQPMATLLCHVYTIRSRLSLLAARAFGLPVASRGGTPE